MAAVGGGEAAELATSETDRSFGKSPNMILTDGRLSGVRHKK